MKPRCPQFILVLCLLWGGQRLSAQQAPPPPPALGLEFSDPQFLKSSQQVFADGFGAAPSPQAVPAFSLSKDLPKPGYQGSFNSCVAWATGYAFMSNLLWTGQLSDAPLGSVAPAADRSKPLSPCFIYNVCSTRNLVKKVGNTTIPPRRRQLTGPAGPTLWYQEAFACIEQYGTCFHKQMDSPVGVPSAEAIATASEYKSKLGMTSIPYNSQMKEAIKNCLYNQQTPVLLGIKVDQRFSYTNSGPFDDHPATDVNGHTQKIWKTYREPALGGHAMVITGWDEKLQCYEVMNSWGDWGGNQGFVWIHYDLLRDLMKKGDGEMWRLYELKAQPVAVANATGSRLGWALPPEVDFYCSMAERVDKLGVFRVGYFGVTPQDITAEKIVPGTVLELQAGMQVYCRTQRPHRTVKGLVWPVNASDPIIRGPLKVKVQELLSFQINERGIDGTVTHFWIGCKRLP